MYTRMSKTAFDTIIPREDQVHPEDHAYECESVITRLIKNADNKVPLVVTCPHAGILIPDDVEGTLAVDKAEVLSRGDRFTDWLTVNAPAIGAKQIISKIAPTILNVGRSPMSLDARDVRGGAGSLNTEIDKYTHGNISQGIVAYKTLCGGHPLYKAGQEPDEAEIRNRLDTYYYPFHDTLDSHIEHTADKFGYALVFDIHSAPSVGTHADVDAGEPRPDLIFSNNPNEHGVSVDNVLLNELVALAEQHGLRASINYPYQGGFVTQQYGANGPKGEKDYIEAFQVEYNRAAIGVDEQTLELVDKAKFASVQTFTNTMLQHVARYAQAKSEASLSC